jgi:class 3 adenylate cyclase
MVRIRTQLELKDAREKLEELVRQMEISTSLLKNSGEEMGRQKKALELQRNKADSLLLNVLPEFVALELKEKGYVTPRHYAVVSILFADLAGFTIISKGLNPEEIVDELNKIFVGFDTILERNDMEKIKTLGDGYMAAGGLPIQNGSNPMDAVTAGLEMLEFVRGIKLENLLKGKPPWELRVGIHTGQVVAGVIGKNKFTYDVWGATVNTASRMETASEPGMVNISGITYQLVKDKFNCSRRGNVDVKNMGKMDMYFVNGPLDANLAADKLNASILSH